ncbi:protein rsi-1 [Quercus suber]|uniref:Protein rsi-1 n=1 Tax=Quercus suber TaxID=58331 RepID=A0AAW0KXD0_QUESU
MAFVVPLYVAQDLFFLNWILTIPKYPYNFTLPPTTTRHMDCKPKCTYRCSATSHKKPCMFFCLKCCVKCHCVPPGTSGNRQVCPCYNNWKTKEGGHKCP